MKGYVYYTKDESVRNRLFIEELIQEAQQSDVELRLLIEEEEPELDADFILFRARDPEKAKAFENAGFRLFNRSEVNRIANDKLKTIELASLLGVPVVPTKRIETANEIESYPVILKTVDGHGGSEVFLCKSSDETEMVFNKFHDRKLIAQPYIESNATDVRVFLIGEEVVGAVKRTGKDSFKSNYTLGGSIEKYTLSTWKEKEASKIARALKSDYIGIDFLLLPDGRWMLNEIEDPVGARSLYMTHNFSIATKLIDFVKTCVVKYDYI